MLSLKNKKLSHRSLCIILLYSPVYCKLLHLSLPEGTVFRRLCVGELQKSDENIYIIMIVMIIVLIMHDRDDYNDKNCDVMI